jgi:small redox-active disulfide protein 2
MSVKNIKALGSGCRNCQQTYELIRTLAAAQGVEVQLEKIEDMATILGYGIMSTPGVVVDEQVVHAGGVPDRNQVEGWLA